jgi:hypothetical protein
MVLALDLSDIGKEMPREMKLRILTEKLLVISQRFFSIPPCRFYALAN